MKATYLAALFFAALALPVQAIDLTPQYVSTIDDGVVSQRPYFADGEKKYAVKLDSETKLSAYEGGALFTFAKSPDARMLLRPSPLPSALPFPDNLPQYEEAARGLLPPDAQDVALVTKVADPLPINDWKSYSFTFTYHTANQPRRQSITFLNLKPSEQIVMQAAASEADFENIAGRAFNIIRRWHEVPASSEQRFN